MRELTGARWPEMKQVIDDRLYIALKSDELVTAIEDVVGEGECEPALDKIVEGVYEVIGHIGGDCDDS